MKTSFLHGDLGEEIFMAQPKGFEVQGKENLVCKLHKSLHGLKQAPRKWYKKFNEFMRNSRFHRYEEDHYCYVKKYVDSYIIHTLYVEMSKWVSTRELTRLTTSLSWVRLKKIQFFQKWIELNPAHLTH